MTLALKKIAFALILSAFCASASAQFYFEPTSAVEKEKSIIDSVGFVKNHPNAKGVSDQSKLLLEKIKKAGWLESEIIETTKTNDSTFRYVFALGARISTLSVYIGGNPEMKDVAFSNQKNDTITMAFSEAENFMNRTLALMENKGYSQVKLQLVNLHRHGHLMSADLEVSPGKKRQVNDIVVSGYEKFPEGHKKQIRRLYRNKTFNKETLAKIHSAFQKFRFVNQTRYPEILFMEDTTKVYVYLEKTKANRFDGFVGFSNDESDDGSAKVRFTGYIDLLLVNAVNTGEQFSLYWKSDGKKQTTFNAAIELPYIFKSPIGLKAGLNIFKQDSTFQNTKTAIALGYYFNYNTRLYLGYESTESSDIQNQNTSAISDFNNSFVTSAFEFTDYRPDEFLFPEKTKAIIRSGIGSRRSKLQSDSQFFADVSLLYNLYLNEKNIVNLKSQNFYLQSGDYIVSELHRFGGITSIRGFNENSLQANLFTSLLTEYRYIFAPGLYLHTIVDYGYYRDQTRSDAVGKSGNLLGLGLGFGLLTKNGLFNIVYANGTAKGQEIKLSNSIVHISFKANF